MPGIDPAKVGHFRVVTELAGGIDLSTTQTKTDLQPEWGLSQFNPWDRRITEQNIWPIYRAMRQQGPVVYSEALGGFWCVTRYKEVRTAALDYRNLSSGHVLEIGKQNWTNKPRVRLIETDPPEHTRHRKAMQAPILQKRMGEFSNGIRESVQDLLDHIAQKGEFDIVADLAEPIPQEVLGRILGFDEETRRRNRELVRKFVQADLETSEEAHGAFWEFLIETIEDRLRHPGEDFLSQLCMTEVDGQRFTESELVGMLHGFALAGHHTAIDAISSMLLHVSDDYIKHAYQDDPSIGTQIVEETLRIASPIHLEGRSTTTDIVIGDVNIPAGESVALLYASANHDESQFDNPEEFNPKRTAIQHLAFGYGIHMCIGLHLARLEMNVVLEEMVKRFPNYRVTGTPEGTGMVFGHHMGWESIPAAIA